MIDQTIINGVLGSRVLGNQLNTEYNIAIEELGRISNPNPTSNSQVSVQTHLKESDHSVLTH